MYRTGAGVIFDSVTYPTLSGNTVTAIKEERKATGYNGIAHIKAVFGVDVNFQPTKPAYIKSRQYMSSMVDLFTSGDNFADLGRFFQSHRAIYTVIGTTYLVCSLDCEINMATREYVKPPKIEFFLPKTVVHIPPKFTKGEKKDGVLCDQLSTSTGTGKATVAPQYLQAITQRVALTIQSNILDYGKFTLARVG